MAAVKQAGVTDAQIVDVTMAIASIVFTNLFNRINDTGFGFSGRGLNRALMARGRHSPAARSRR